MNGYLADGSRVRVPYWFAQGDRYAVHRLREPLFSLVSGVYPDPDRLVHYDSVILRKMRLCYSADAYGPLEGDGNWTDYTHDTLERQDDRFLRVLAYWRFRRHGERPVDAWRLARWQIVNKLVERVVTVWVEQGAAIAERWARR